MSSELFVNAIQVIDTMAKFNRWHVPAMRKFCAFVAAWNPPVAPIQRATFQKGKICYH